jgi:hypothetical protein
MGAYKEQCTGGRGREPINQSITDSNYAFADSESDILQLMDAASCPPDYVDAPVIDNNHHDDNNADNNDTNPAAT